MNVYFELGNVIEIKEIFTVFEQAANYMIDIGIYQWDSIYPNIDVIKNDLYNNGLYVGKINHQIAVVFVLNNDYDEQYDNGNWMHNSEPFEVIHRLCVHPKFQNKGIGRIAMEYIENRLSSAGIRSIRLDTFSLNPYALKLYASLGFHTVGEANWRKGKFYLMEKILRV